MDYEDLSLILPKDASISMKMDAVAIKTFINSNGEITEFSFDGNTNTVYTGETIIFDGSDLEEEFLPYEEDESTKSENEETDSVGKIGGADGPTSLFIVGNPFGVFLVSAALIALTVLIIIYIKKKK